MTFLDWEDTFAVSKTGKFKLVITRDTQGVAASHQLKSKYLISGVYLLCVPQIKSVVSQSYLKGIFLFNCVIMNMIHCGLPAGHNFSRSKLNYIYVCISFNLLDHSDSVMGRNNPIIFQEHHTHSSLQRHDYVYLLLILDKFKSYLKNANYLLFYI